MAWDLISGTGGEGCTVAWDLNSGTGGERIGMVYSGMGPDSRYWWGGDWNGVQWHGT